VVREPLDPGQIAADRSTTPNQADKKRRSNTMNTTKLGALGVRRLPLALAFAAGTALGAILPLGFRRRVAATGAAAALAATSLLGAQPVAADTAYPVNVTFDSLKFTMVIDGCSGLCLEPDSWLEIYGTVGAYTTAGASSAAGGLPYRIFGKWGSDVCETLWDATYGTNCSKEVTVGSRDFTKVFLCNGSYYQSCSSAYYKSNNTIPLQVHAGEQFKVTVAIQDYDAWSSNDNVCVTSAWFGPYTAAQLQAKTFVNDVQYKALQMPYNGNAECFVKYHLS
jgi:hypothetical protein